MPTKQSIGIVQTISMYGFDGTSVHVETDIRAGLPSLKIVGMGSKSINEARHRVKSAILNTGLAFPAKRLVVNLSPAELPKDGTHFDLPVAISILCASGQLLPHHLKDTLFVGELSLTGRLLPIRGATLITEAAREMGMKRILIPQENYNQASPIDGIEIIAAKTLQEVFWHLTGVKTVNAPTLIQPAPLEAPVAYSLDDVAGHLSAKRALMIAVAGKHNILLHGPPGTGKTHMARAAASLLPPLAQSESIEVTKIHSLAHLTNAYISTPPFRSPHHSTTRAALVGGGAHPTPGEVSLAHKGVLLLDELPEYSKDALEALRQPLQDRYVTISRAHGTITYPADPLLIATMNPCPCGFLDDPGKSCSCSPANVSAYKRRVSGPLLDRIDLHVQVPRSTGEYIFDSKSLTKTQHSSVVEAIISIRSIQKLRYKRSFIYNGNAPLLFVKNNFRVQADTRQFLKQAQSRLALSGRSVLQSLRVARTIADAESSQNITPEHIAEALQFRSLS